jgi:hypothetical protein
MVSPLVNKYCNHIDTIVTLIISVISLSYMSLCIISESMTTL